MRIFSTRSFLGLPLLAAGVLGLVSWPTAGRADLDEYIKKNDPAFAWKQIDQKETPMGKVTELELTSQVWQEITWTHNLRIYEPKQTTYNDAALLFISGGSTGKKPGLDTDMMAFTLARVTGARVALLSQVPNQPLYDGLYEDALIAETFVRYLEDGDEEWPLLFPMTKSAVKAMDAVQAWAKDAEQPEINRFVVTGASKRGWTTWLTGAVDDRVVGIAPMVIVMLNIGAQGQNQLDVWGFYSEQIHDYVERGLMEKIQTEKGTKLWRMVDPYTYRDRLADKPIFLINGANDPYWTLNALDLYWSDLPGVKHVVELPNAGHGLDANREWAINGVGAFFRSVVSDRPLPKLDWKFEADSGGQYTLKIQADPAPKSARLWTAEAPNRDYRKSEWTSTELEPGAIVQAFVTAAKEGNKAVFADLEYELDGIPYHLTTTFFEPGVDAKSKKAQPVADSQPAAAATAEPVGAGADR